MRRASAASPWLSSLFFISGDPQSRDSMWRPPDHVLPSREVQEWLAQGLGGKAGSLCHGVVCEVRLGELQLPGEMLDFAAKESAFRIGRIQAIALGQKVLQCSRSRLKGRTGGSVAALKNRVWCATMTSLAAILHPPISLLALHARTKVREMKGQPSGSYGKRVCSVQAKEPHTWLFLRRHISSNI